MNTAHAFKYGQCRPRSLIKEFLVRVYTIVHECQQNDKIINCKALSRSIPCGSIPCVNSMTLNLRLETAVGRVE